ncbi:unnamed protein product [Leuciscus chuanchicus]
MASSIEEVVVPLSVEVGHLVGAHKERYFEKLEIAGLDTDPYLLPTSVFTDLIKSPSLPDFGPHDLYHYVVNGVSPYTGADLKAFKSLDAYQFFVAGWVTGTRCYANGGGRYLIMAKVHHSQSLSETQLQPWVSLKKDGTVLCGHCTCKAGLGEVCSHVTALLYAIDSAVKHLEDKSCTDGPRQWGLPPLKAGKALYEEGSGIDFSNPAKKRCGVNNQSHSGCPSVKKVGVSAAAIEQFYKALDNATPNPSEKSGILRILPHYCKQFQPKVVSLGLPQPLTELYSAQNRKLSASDLEKKCDAVFNDMEVTPEQAVKVEEETRQQGKSRLWFDMRAGRVTASRFKWGCEHEQKARETYEAYAAQQHQDLSVRDAGLHIDTSRPYLGASPDALLSCSCCGDGILEIKCPHCAKDTGVLSATEKKHFCIENTDEAVQNVEAFYRSAILSELLAKTYTCPDRLLSDKTQSTDSQELEEYTAHGTTRNNHFITRTNTNTYSFGLPSVYRIALPPSVMAFRIRASTA